MGKTGKRPRLHRKSYTVSWVEEHTLVVRAVDEREADAIAQDTPASEHQIDIDNYRVQENEPMFSGEDLK